MKPFSCLLVALALFAVVNSAAAIAEEVDGPLTGERILLWPDGAPDAKDDGPIHRPAIYRYLPENPNGVGIVVCPGGGYSGLALNHEGEQVAKWLNENGIAAFVLRYRHAPLYQHPTPRGDVRRAVRLVRANAEAWGVDPSKIGVLGFSAGGHLTATAATQFEAGNLDAADPLERISSRPDFAAPIYPVISMKEPHGHMGSQRALLGADPSPELVEQMSLDTQVTKDTPPIFIAFTTEDTVVPVQNGLIFYEACVNAGVPAELHIFEKGRHGLGLGGEDLPFKAWPSLFLEWLRNRELLE